MEVALRYYWRVFRDAVSSFLGEAGFRISLAWSVLLGRFPIYRERRWWNRATETPILIEVEDWTDERLLFSILVWPSLESSVPTALRDQETRARQVKKAWGRACNGLAWTTRFDTDFGLRWDPEREVWTASDGFSYEPPARLGRDGEDAA